MFYRMRWVTFIFLAALLGACNDSGDYDADQALCGNGVLDASELCDYAIAAGESGACPTNCDDSDPCTQDVLVGEANSCTQVCEHSPISDCSAKKGLGESCGLDAECASAYCKDGVCAERKKAVGEECALASECESGSCEDSRCVEDKLANGQPCVDSQECASGLCEANLCVAQKLPNGESCTENAQCLSNACVNEICAQVFVFPPRGTLLVGATCEKSADCHSLACVGGLCADACTLYANDACSAGENCISTQNPDGAGMIRICVPAGPNKETEDCTSDLDCSVNLGCNTIQKCMKYCLEEDGKLDDCGEGLVCVRKDLKRGMCTTACTPGPNDSCGAGQTCHIRLSAVDAGACHLAGSISEGESCNNLTVCERGNVCWSTNTINQELICERYCRSKDDCPANTACNQFFDKTNSTLGLCQPLPCNLPLDCASKVCINNICLQGCSSVLDDQSCDEKRNCLAYNSYEVQGALVYACTKAGPLAEGEPCARYSECGKGLVCGPSLRCQKICTVGGNECASDRFCFEWSDNKGTCEIPCLPGPVDQCTGNLTCSPGSTEIDAGLCEIMGTVETGLPLKLGESCEYDADCKKAAGCAATSTTKPAKICLSFCRMDASPSTCPEAHNCEAYDPSSSSTLGVCRPINGVVIDPDEPVIPEPVDPPTLKNIGEACVKHSDCLSKLCDLSTSLCKGECEIYEENVCPDNQVCATTAALGTSCLPLASSTNTEGRTCLKDDKCAHNLYCGAEETCRKPCVLGSACEGTNRICAPAVFGATKGLCYEACDPVDLDACNVYNYCEPMVGDNTKGYCLMWTDQGDWEYSVPPSGFGLNHNCSVNADCDHGLGCQPKVAGSPSLACLRYCNVNNDECGTASKCVAIKKDQALGVCRALSNLTHDEACQDNSNCKSGVCDTNTKRCLGDCALYKNNSCGQDMNCVVDEQKSSRCEIAGTRLEGASCSSTLRCAMNLSCGVDNLCHSYCSLNSQDCGSNNACLENENSKVNGLCYPHCNPLQVSCTANNYCEPLKMSSEIGTCRAVSIAYDGLPWALGLGKTCQDSSECAIGLACLPASKDSSAKQCLKYCSLKTPGCDTNYACQVLKTGYDLGVCQIDTLPPPETRDIEDGSPCRDSIQCKSEVCKNNICLANCQIYAENDECPMNERCTRFKTPDGSSYIYACDANYYKRGHGEGCSETSQCDRSLICQQNYCVPLCTLGSTSCDGQATCTKIEGSVENENYGYCKAKPCLLGTYNFQNPSASTEGCDEDYKCAQIKSEDAGICIPNKPSATMIHEMGGNNSCFSEQECPKGGGCEGASDGYFYCIARCRVDAAQPTCPSNTVCYSAEISGSSLGLCYPQ